MAIMRLQLLAKSRRTSEWGDERVYFLFILFPIIGFCAFDHNIDLFFLSVDDIE
jgi:hypothetical protein